MNNKRKMKKKSVILSREQIKRPMEKNRKPRRKLIQIVN
jgi:hypothetical protein